MIRKIAALALAASLAAVTLAHAGGHATIKVAELPKRFVAGETVPVSFTVHDAVGNAMNDLRPSVIATLGRRRVVVDAVAAKRNGAYEALMKFPASGEWTLTVDSKYCGNTCVVRGVQVSAAKQAVKI